MFGSEYNGVRTNGLVDCEDEEFVSALKDLKKDLPTPVLSWIESSKGRLRPFSSTIEKCMLKSVRTAAGLGNPPNKYDNQRCESFNTSVKDNIQRKKVDQVVMIIHEVMEERVVESQKEELIKSIYCTGEYRLAEDYRHLEKKLHRVEKNDTCPEAILR